MTNIKYGLTSWDEVELKQPTNGGQKSEFMRLDSGSNIMRIITRPFQYLVHTVKEEGDSGYGDKVKCSKFHGECPLCDGTPQNKPKRRWYVGVIDRKTQTYKILDISSTIFKAIQELSRDEDYGEPSKYDVDIKVDKQGGATGYYTVIPKPPKALSAQDTDLKSKVNLDDLVRRCAPPTVERVKQDLERIASKKNGNRPAQASKTPVDMRGEDEDYTFPAASA